jgi:two-component system sensor histidine kinase UhpB
MRWFAIQSAGRVFVVVLAAVFLVETSIMLFVETTGIGHGDRWSTSLLDGSLLVVVLSPVLWYLVARPLRAAAALRGEMLARTIRSLEEERARLARELHDELGQTQTAILLAARCASRAADLESARTAAEDAARMAGGAIEATRRIARGLAPSVLLDLGLATAVERLCEDVSAASGLEITRSVELGVERPAADVELAAYRIVQEAVHNAVKHARAARVDVSIRRVGPALAIEVVDDGDGLSSAAEGVHAGLGVQGMRERAAMLGGRCEIGPSTGGGVRVSAVLPDVQRERVS